MKKHLLEVCVDSVESAIRAVEGGADRLELCSNLIIGGTTPSTALFEAIRKRCNIKIHVLIRPRFGDFNYSEYEFEVIKNEVKLFKALGADGIVIGMLKIDGTLDYEHMKELIKIAEGMSITLHRAFDVCVDPYEALEQAVCLGVHTILTSGQKNNALAGKEVIKKLVEQADQRIDILVGSGVSANIIEEIYETTGATSYHMSGKVEKESAMLYKKQGVNMGLEALSEFIKWETDVEKIKQAKGVLKSLCS